MANDGRKKLEKYLKASVMKELDERRKRRDGLTSGNEILESHGDPHLLTVGRWGSVGAELQNENGVRGKTKTKIEDGIEKYHS